MSVIGSIATRRAWIGFSGRCPPAARALVIKAAPDSAGYPSDACPPFFIVEEPAQPPSSLLLGHHRKHRRAAGPSLRRHLPPGAGEAAVLFPPSLVVR
jgi:hypothetical protein